MVAIGYEPNDTTLANPILRPLRPGKARIWILDVRDYVRGKESDIVARQRRLDGSLTHRQWPPGDASFVVTVEP